MAFFQKLRRALQLIHGERVDFSKYEDGIRSLLNTFVASQPVQKKIEAVMLHDTKAVEAQMAEIEGKKAKAAYIRTRLVAELEGKRYEDPLMFKKFSDRIRTTLDEYRQQRDENAYFEKMQQLADDFKQGLIGQHYPVCIANDQKAKAFYGISSKVTWQDFGRLRCQETGALPIDSKTVMPTLSTTRTIIEVCYGKNQKAQSSG